MAILGSDGAQALAKAAERSPSLQAVLVPRAILAWLNVLGTDPSFEGDLPGVENSYVCFAKAENSYTGTISVGDTSYGFQDASPMHLAASIGIALGLDADTLDPELRDLDLQRLGRSIDLLAKARAAVESLGKRQLDPSAGYQLGHQHYQSEDFPEPRTTVFATHPSAPGEHVGEATFIHNPDGKTLTPETSSVRPQHRRQGLASAIYAHAEKLTGKVVVPSKDQSDKGKALWQGNKAVPQFGRGAAQAMKAEPAGPAAKPQEQGQPLAPTPPQKQPKTNTVKTPKASAPGKAPAAPKQPSVRLTMSEAQKTICGVCAMPQFNGERFVGCLCFSELAKSTATERTPEGLTVTFGPEWDPEALDVFVGGLVHPDVSR